jgi:4-amino-4-deoxy-L-arabinose transferase-like glycosyltransferase
MTDRFLSATPLPKTRESAGLSSAALGAWAAAALAVAVFALHAAVSNHYDFYRDELYFIVCGQHPALGYVDQPPLIPLLAAASQLFGESRIAIHLIAALGGAATVLVACATVRLLRGGVWAQVLAGMAAGFAPIYLALASTLSTSTFEPLAWGLTAYFLLRAVLERDRRALLFAGLVVGVALETKYGIPFYVAALLLGLALTPERKLLRTREFALAVAIAAALFAPNFVWQLRHGFPMLPVLLANVDHKDLVLSPPEFLANQALMMNPLLAPVWLAGLVAPFAGERWRRLRFLSIAFAAVFLVMLALHAKNYYLSPAYVAAFAVGAVALERSLLSLRLRNAYLGLAFASTAVLAPLPIPMLAPEQYLIYEHALGFHDAPVETRAQSRIPQLFADMTGWHDLARSVAVAYDRLAPEDRAHAAIFTYNYGEASAIDLFGGALGLPKALSGHNNFYLWGPGKADGHVVLLVGAKLARLSSQCREASVVGSFGAPFALPEEHGDIVLCRDLGQGFHAAWTHLRHYD